MLNGEPIEILLVEDNPNDVELILRAFTKKNLANKVYVATDGAQALDFVFCRGIHSKRDIKVSPKVIILDQKLPMVDGKEVLKQIKADERTRAIPVVVMTSSQEESDVIASYNFGANSYIVKPVDFEKFSTMVAELGWYWVFINKQSVL